MKRTSLALISVFTFIAATGIIIANMNIDPRFVHGEIAPYEVSVTITASDISYALEHENTFTKGTLSFAIRNIGAENNRIWFLGNNTVKDTQPMIDVLTGSIPDANGELSGQGFTKVNVAGYDGTGYGLVGVNSYENENGHGYIGYSQFRPQASQTVVPSTSESKPVAKYIRIFGKYVTPDNPNPGDSYNYSVTSLTFVYECAKTKEDEPDPDAFNGRPLINFDNNQEETSTYTIRDGYSNDGGLFLTTWERGNLSLNGVGSFTLSDDLQTGDNYGVEVRYNSGVHYGYFGGRMKAFSRNGTVQSIFTYNGGENYDHDEIDIEILGKDTTKVQFNYYDDGVGGHEYIHDLGFDASLDYHDYGFCWDVDKITWYVDFIPVYSIDVSLDQWGFLYANVWAGNPNNEIAKNWLGEYVPSETPSVAYYDYLSYAPLNEAPVFRMRTPENRTTVDVVDERVSNYIKAFRAKGALKENDYFLDVNEVNTTDHTPRILDYYEKNRDGNLSKGEPIKLSFYSTESGPYKVYVSRNADMSDATIYETSNKYVEIYSSFINTDYYWQVKTEDETYSSLVYKYTTDDTSRFIYTNKLSNVRDIGGKMTSSGKRIKQGLVYRGPELNIEEYDDSRSSHHYINVDEATRAVLVDELGIGAEIDLRGTNELKDPVNTPASIDGFDYWHGSMAVRADGWTPAYAHVTRDINNIAPYKYIFRNFLKVADTPIYVHCAGGFDRTGTVCFILEGILGVSFTDLCIDYELSSYCRDYRFRDVNCTDSDGFPLMIEKLVENAAATNEYEGYNPGGNNTVQTICENILLKSGLTINEINQIRSLMLED